MTIGISKERNLLKRQVFSFFFLLIFFLLGFMLSFFLAVASIPHVGSESSFLCNLLKTMECYFI